MHLHATLPGEVPPFLDSFEKHVTKSSLAPTLVMMNWIRSHWSKISTGLFVGSMLVTGAVFAKSYFGNDCCSAGAECCKPGAPCCNGHNHK